jgi:uncharacterized OsmC-like protein
MVERHHDLLATEPLFVSRVSVTAGAARTKHVTLPLVDVPVPMGMHGDVASHYGVPEASYEPHATTLDFLVGAAVACLCGTFGGLLSPLGQPVSDGELVAEGAGKVINDGGTLRVVSIDVEYRLRAHEGVDREAVVRAHSRHTSLCPIARSIGTSISISTRLTLLGGS